MAKYVDNSSLAGDVYNGRIKYVGDGTELAGADWLPLSQSDINARYLRDGTINLKALADGRGSCYIDSNYIPSPEDLWCLDGVYNVVMEVSYDLFEIEYHGDGTASIWYGDQDNILTLAPEDANLIYIPPTESYKFYDQPVLPIIPTVSIGTIADITDTDPHEVTLTFNTEPYGNFVLSDIVYDTNNGVTSNLVQTSDPKVWTFDYTAFSGIDNATNVLTVTTRYWDLFGNQCAQAISSNSFSIGSIVQSEMLIDPDITNASNWRSVPSSGGYVVFNGTLEQLEINNTSGGAIRIYPDLNTEPEDGGVYKVSGNFSNFGGGGYRFYCGNAWDGNWLYGSGYKEATITWDGTDNGVSIQCLDGTIVTVLDMSAIKV